MGKIRTFTQNHLLHPLMSEPHYNSLAFFRRYYHIPSHRRIAWALIVESVNGRSDVRLGVVFRDYPHLYLDVAMRRFFPESTLGNGTLSRRVWPARREVCSEGFRYLSDNGLVKITPRNYIRDIYFTALFSPELLTQVLY